MKTIMAEARAHMGRGNTIGEVATQARSTVEDVAVAFLVSPQAEAAAVRSVLSLEPVREILEEVVNEDEPAGVWVPDWIGSENIQPHDEDHQPTDVPRSPHPDGRSEMRSDLPQDGKVLLLSRWAAETLKIFFHGGVTASWMFLAVLRR